MKTTGITAEMGIYDILPTAILVICVIVAVVLLTGVIAALLYIRKNCRLIENDPGDDGGQITRRGRRL
ncbi:hypothetical protein ACQQ9V_09215 [Hornefia butyriciproducens]|uniref:hypothetical protein n=1 Tax=Hornefia butyriciproducens TaxID=2652293 RepID=UPI0023F44774|nr:hypothetical protein [Hornefia butyriciproducens]MCI7327512.1 hypothetical protein [Clostridiales bacterium]MDD6299462.1 hypothetical protein [Hornefia butyriciproducens]MDY2990757.1 hypothetical protein [Hornefia butyriciproducens]